MLQRIQHIRALPCVGSVQRGVVCMARLASPRAYSRDSRAVVLHIFQLQHPRRFMTRIAYLLPDSTVEYLVGRAPGVSGYALLLGKARLTTSPFLVPLNLESHDHAARHRPILSETTHAETTPAPCALAAWSRC